MKKVALAAAMALALGGTAKADIFDYAELFGGATIEPSLSQGSTTIDMSTGVNVGAALGWNFGPNISVEAEGLYTSSDFDSPTVKAELETFSFMANAYWAFDIGSRWKPYVGAGVGGVAVTVTDGSVVGVTTFGGDSKVVFGYQAMAGVTIPVAANIDFLAEYRYQGAQDASITLLSPTLGPNTFDQEYKSSNLSAGFRFHL